MPLDFQAARAVTRARLFERAVHDTGPWAVRIGDVTEFAVKVSTRRGVLFIAHFEPGVEGEVAWLICRGEEVSSREITPAPQGFALDWWLIIDDTELARV